MVENPPAARPDYKNSRPLDVHSWSEHPAVRTVTERLFDEFAAEIPPRADRDDHRKHLRVLVLDLYHRFVEDREGWIGVSLNRNGYSGPRRYNKLFLSFRPMHRIVRLLRDYGFLDWGSGFHDRQRRVGYTLRMRASDRLKDLFRDLHEIVGVAPFNEPVREEIARELIILRDHFGADIEYDENDRTSAMRMQLQTYNDFLRQNHIDISLRGWPKPEVIDLTNKRLHRVFNKESWELGGRYYGGWWQNVDRDLRRRIVISDKPTVEIDYSGLHIVLLYAREGIDYFAQVDQDPYMNSTIFPLGFEDPKDRQYHRAVMKTLSLIAINAGDEWQAIRGATQEIYGMGNRDTHCIVA